MLLQPFSFPVPETRFIIAGSFIYKFKIGGSGYRQDRHCSLHLHSLTFTLHFYSSHQKCKQDHWPIPVWLKAKDKERTGTEEIGCHPKTELVIGFSGRSGLEMTFEIIITRAWDNSRWRTYRTKKSLRKKGKKIKTRLGTWVMTFLAFFRYVPHYYFLLLFTFCFLKAENHKLKTHKPNTHQQERDYWSMLPPLI